MDDPHDGLIEVGVVIDDYRVLAAHLRDHPFDVVLPRLGVGRLAVDQKTDVARAGECDHVNVRMVDERLAGLLAKPRQIVKRTRGHAGFVEHAREMPAHDRRLLGRLEDDRIAGDQCGHGHAAGYGQRKIPGRDDHRYAPRDVLGIIGLAWNVALPRLGEPDHLPRIEFAEIDGFGNVAIRFFPGLSAFKYLPCRQLEAAPAQNRRSLDQDLARRSAGVVAQSELAARAAATARTAWSGAAMATWPAMREVWLGLIESMRSDSVSISRPFMIKL